MLESMLAWSGISAVVTRSSVVEWRVQKEEKRCSRPRVRKGMALPAQQMAVLLLPTALGASWPHDTDSSQGENSQGTTVLTLFLLTLENKHDMGHHLRPGRCSL